MQKKTKKKSGRAEEFRETNEKESSEKKALAAFMLLSIGIVLIDQFSKYIIRNSLKVSESIELVKGFFSITYVQNTGVAFGLFKGHQAMFIYFSIFFIGMVLLFYDKIISSKRLLVPFALLVGGTIGNLIDRVFYGYVTDFFDFVFSGYHWATFNIADSAITIGAVLIIVWAFAEKDDKKRYAQTK